jgi:SAM-dependent methyltransferase
LLLLKRNYDTIAWFYDRLSRLIYGKSLIKAQQYLVRFIPAGARVLVAGGGTGWVLEEIQNIHPSGLTITYVDASAKMIARAEKRNIGANEVAFITGPVEQVVLHGKYDVVLTPFLFDNFSEESLQNIFARIHARLSPSSLWLYCDFRDTGVLWQKMVLKIMYLFFRLTCSIEATHLPDAKACFHSHNYKAIAQQTFISGFIESEVYKRFV